MARERTLALGVGVVALVSAFMLARRQVPEVQTIDIAVEAPKPAIAKQEPVADEDTQHPRRRRPARLGRDRERIPLAQRRGPREAPSELERRELRRSKKMEQVSTKGPKGGRLQGWRKPENMAGAGTSGVWTRVAVNLKEIDPALSDQARRLSVDLRETRTSDEPVDWDQLMSRQRDLLATVAESEHNDDVMSQKIERITAALDYMASNPDWQERQEQPTAQRQDPSTTEGTSPANPG